MSYKPEDFPQHREQIRRQLAAQEKPLTTQEKQWAEEIDMTGAANKFSAVKTEANGIRFDSAGESRRYQQLRLLEKAGEIQNLRCQVPLNIDINGQRVCTYNADFTYREGSNEVVEDFKSGPTKTPVYKLKKRLVQAVLGITIRETEKCT